MESSSSRNNSKAMSQAEIKRQIAELERQLIQVAPESTEHSAPKSPKRKAPEPVTLAPATPSPKKKRKLEHPRGKPLSRPVFQAVPQQNSARVFGTGTKPIEDKFKKTAPSNLINKLASVGRPTDLDEDTAPVVKSTGFTDNPTRMRSEPNEHLAQRRDERLALVENIEAGPYEHTPPQDDPDFQRLEPHSGINLSSRVIVHDEFSSFFTDRYYISPSRLYSAIRLLPDKQGYEVPVLGDWITIAVVAERSPIKFTRAPVKMEREEGEHSETRKPWKGKAKAEPERPGKKFVNIKLIDFGARSGNSTSSKAVIRGDALLTLLLFEADSIEYIDGDGQKSAKFYRGGSGGAFEHLTNVREGDVIALLNPKILKPFQRSTDKPHPVDNILAVTPETSNSIIVVGRCCDLGMCQVRKQDGKVCGSWCDKRVSEVCDYHLQSAVQRRRAARPEFSIGTGGMSAAPTHKRKHDYDPREQWGLKPEEKAASGSATYMVSGHVVSGTSSDSRTLYTAESIGREGQAKARRRLLGQDGDDALKKLLARDKDGMRAVMKARQVGHTSDSGKGKKGGKGKGDTQRTAEVEEQDSDDAAPKTAYSAEIIKSLGFDPGLKMGQKHKKASNEGIKNKLEALETMRMARKDPELGPKPGPRIRSGVRAPIRQPNDSASSNHSEVQTKDIDLAGVDYDDFPDELAGNKTTGGPDSTGMVDLDDF